MHVVIAREAGFCFGVKLAIEQAFEAAGQAGGQAIHTLGPLIHNPPTIQKLMQVGVVPVDRLDQVPGGTVVIRSHGVPKQIKQGAKDLGLDVVDATCPFVTRVQNAVARLSKEGCFVVVVGDASHPEVVGIVSHIVGPHKVMSGRDDLEGIPVQTRKIGVVAQTTMRPDRFKEVICQLLDRCNELTVINTICDATEIKQSDARVQAATVDAMLVVGGKNSSNTRKLAQICAEVQPNTHHIETADEIDSAWFAQVDSVGVTAGASTPDWLIDEVVVRLRALGGDTVDDLRTSAEEQARQVQDQLAKLQ
ncbi:MAG: 4-hydroxy-3-methylbut-2-enyl diphosphate reductase [Alphaproteobacteria bacterium CG_4_10_14_0_2_um_filter_63_37]|nr:MAG: 4-hydroxy-3-methylbut-2-enyl diphosphate reductase [Proteobacteria bacterium CG1_02_64_396]PJA23538.1 MAG: 4-hydroxy-3-methylbut-2-enyl diphosphate reductase [Alphaproteobacteria bacterium CG_4_10_14_0_2_um_filter_63_37]